MVRFFSWIRAAVFVACLIPLGLLGVNGYNDNLGANPIEVITHWTGDWTLTFLLITLSVTPLRKITGLPWLIKLRRMLGLFAFFYASLHFMTYIWLDQFFDPGGIVKDVAKRPFITAGFTSFVLLLPLAVTSTGAMIRRLGRNWQRLHRLVYAVSIGGVIHYLWLVKADIFWPVTYGAILTILLATRAVLNYRARPLRGSERGAESRMRCPIE